MTMRSAASLALLGVALAAPQTFAQAPARKDEKKGQMMDKKAEKKKKDKRR